MAGNVSQDKVSLIVDAESAKAQQAIHELEKSSKKLREENAARIKQMLDLEKHGQKESDYYKNLKALYDSTRKEINENSKAIAEHTKKINVNNLTMAQLRKEAKQLQRQMDNTAKSLNPEAYAELESRLKTVKNRMSQLNFQATSLKEIFLSKTNIGFLMGSGIVGAVSAGVSTLISIIGTAMDKIHSLVDEGIEMAKTSDGIRHAFEQLNQPNLLDNLRKATHGTVNDIELMKTAVRAKDFQLPFDQLGKYLEFAQLKAQQTGQSVDYLTESIIMGLGRQSKQILDNLGISAAQITQEMSRGGDMATAVGRIIDQQLQETGEHYEDAAEREKRAITDVQNAQRELGEELLPLQEAGSQMWLTIQKYALKFFTYLVKATKEAVAKFTDIYNGSMLVRSGINAIIVNVKASWEVIKFVFKFTHEAVKAIGKQLLNLGKMIEGVVTLDADKIAEGFQGIFKAQWTAMKNEIKNFYNLGKGVGEAYVDGINETINGKITAPSSSAEKSSNELDEVVVTGTRKDRSYWADQVEIRKKAFEATKKGSKEAAAALKELKEAEAKLGEYNTYSSGGGKKSGKKDDLTKEQREADRKAIEQLKLQRQQELSIEQQNYDALQRLWKEQLSKRAITQQAYDHVMQETALEHAECVLDIERRYGNDSEKLTLNDNSQKLRLLNEQQKNINQAEKNAADARLRAFEVYQKNLQALQASAMSPQEKEKFDRESQLKVLEAYYQASLEYAKEHNENLLDVEEAYLKARNKLQDEWEISDKEKHFNARSSAGLTTADEELQHAKDAIDQNTELSPEEKNQAKEQLEREHQERLFQIRQEYGLVKQQELYDQELEQLRLAEEQGYLTTEEYEKAKTQMKMQQYKEQFDYYKELFSSAVNALQDAELANVEAKYDAEIDAAKKAGKDTSKLEEKAAEEKLKIQKKYADVQFAIRASEIIADTAQAIIATHKSLGGWTPWAIAAAALMGVTGAAQLAVAAAERNKVKSMTLKGGSSSTATGERVATGKEEGGYLDVEREQDGRMFHAKYDPRRRGYVDRPTVIVGEGPAGQSKEWIASNAAVENPTVSPVLDVLDRAQRAGTIRTLDLNKYLLQHQGFAQGGSISSPPAKYTPMASSTDSSLMERFLTLMERLEQTGIPAHVGLDEIDNKNKLLEQSRKIGSK